MRFTASLILLLLLAGCGGCTVRGGWPRFLRPGEPSDSALKKDAANRESAKVELTKAIALRRTEVVDLYAVGQGLVKQYGRNAAMSAVWDMWGAAVPREKYTNYCDVIWLQSQPPNVEDLAWLACFRDEWAKP